MQITAPFINNYKKNHGSIQEASARPSQQQALISQLSLNDLLVTWLIAHRPVYPYDFGVICTFFFSTAFYASTPRACG